MKCVPCPLALILSSGLLAQAPPVTPKRPVVDVIQGVQVTDDYQWLEKTEDPEVKAWIAAQNLATRKALDARPERPAIRKELKAILEDVAVSRYSFRYEGGRLFGVKVQPPKNQPLLVFLTDPRDLATERVVLDPNLLDPSGKTAIDWYEPSPDGKLVAISLSKNGSEDGTLYIYDAATGKALSDVLPRVQFPTGGGSAAWDADGRGFLYTRYPLGQERPKEDANFYMQVHHHRLGTPIAKDKHVLGKDFPRIAEVKLHRSQDGNYHLADVANGDGGDHAFYLRDPKGAWSRIAAFEDRITSAVFGPDQKLYAISLKDSPRGKILALDLSTKNPHLVAAPVVVSECGATIRSLMPTSTRLYVTYLVGGPTEVRMFSMEGKALGTLGGDPVSTVRVAEHLHGDSILFFSAGYARPSTCFLFDPAKPSAKPERTKLIDPPGFVKEAELADYEVRREMAVSKDGTQVPINIVHRKGIVLNGSHPTLLTGYGGYSISSSPFFDPRAIFWLRHGGVLVDTNIRGGGEFGEAWHRAGNLTRKQNVFDDFIGCAQFLIQKGYTSREKLAIEGWSNGGLLMGAVLVQRPELFKAVVSHVGFYDMMRVELTSNGAFNVTEFGTVKDPAQFKALHAYSPYHHVKDGTIYPPVLFTTGEHDGRVDPWMSYKMTARMQAAGGSNPVVLRVASDAGHGMGTSLASILEEDTDVFTFLFQHLGMR